MSGCPCRGRRSSAPAVRRPGSRPAEKAALTLWTSRPFPADHYGVRKSHWNIPTRWLEVADSPADMGATRVVNVAKQSIKDVMADLHMEGFDVALEMSGNPAAFNDMLDCMYHGGKVALLGILPRGAGIDWDKVIFKGLTLQGIYGRRMYETWYKMTQMVLTGFPLQKVLTHQVHIDDFQKGFDLMDAGNCGKVVCSWT